MNVKKFTIIELIVVIAILGILAGIIIPNISGIKDDSREVQFVANTKNIQTAVDFYSTRNLGNIPSEGIPTIEKPVSIDFEKLVPKYLREKPKEGYYWIDYSGQVWSSTVDAPTGIVIENGEMKWLSSTGDIKNYNLYGVNPITGKTNTVVNLISKQNSSTLVDISKHNYENYLISATDIFGNETAKVGIAYEGSQPVQPVEHINVAPVATLTMSPESAILSDTNIVWDYSSTDESVDTLEHHFKVDNVEVSSLPTVFGAGTHTVEYYSIDSEGLSSNIEIKTFSVEQVNRAPSSSLSMSPMSNLKTNTVITWSYGSLDPDKDTLTNHFIVDGKEVSVIPSTFSAGVHSVQYYATDSKGASSIIQSKTFSVIQYNTVSLNSVSTGLGLTAPTGNPIEVANVSGGRKFYLDDYRQLVTIGSNVTTGRYYMEFFIEGSDGLVGAYSGNYISGGSYKGAGTVNFYNGNNSNQVYLGSGSSYSISNPGYRSSMTSNRIGVFIDMTSKRVAFIDNNYKTNWYALSGSSYQFMITTTGSTAYVTAYTSGFVYDYNMLFN